MNELTIVEQNGVFVADSREVAEMIGKQHKNLLRDIDGYAQIIESSTLSSRDFFIEDSYKSEGNSKSYKRYWLTRKGCDMVANKMTGEKGEIRSAILTHWTQAGRVMIHHILEKRGISAEIDRQKNNLFKLVYVPNV